MFGASLSYTKAAIASAEGRLPQAETLFREAAEKHSQYIYWPAMPFVGDPNIFAKVYHYVIAQLSDVLRRQGRVLEAETEARKVLRLALKAAMKKPSF